LEVSVKQTSNIHDAQLKMTPSPSGLAADGLGEF
jgi:hypothetical protein